MKRSGRLQRTTELTRKTPLRAVAWSVPDSARSVSHQRQARRQATPKRRPAVKPAIPAKVRIALALRSGGRCEMALPGCTGQATDPAHRIRTGMGGRKGAAKAAHDVLSNLIHACRHCHSWTHAEPTAARRLGLMLRDGDNPLTEPCVYLGSRCWLADDGSVSTTTPYAEEATMPNYIQQLTRDLSARLPGCEMDLIDLYALLALTRGTETTLKDVHDAWSVWRNTSRPDHKSLIPFDELAPEVQELDRAYMQAIHEAGKAVA